MKKIANVIIVYDAVLKLDGSGRTVGGVQTYLLSLACSINRTGVKAVILQEGSIDFDRELDGVTILGRKVTYNNSDKKYIRLYEYIKAQYDPGDTLIIWGSFYNARKQSDFTAISIQHGLTFDLIRHSRRNDFVVKLGLSWFIKLFQRSQAFCRFKRVKYRVCVDYNFLNWFRTMSSRIDDANTAVIPNFTDIPSWPVQEKTSYKKILFARRFVDKNGTRFMVEVAGNMIRECPEVEFTFAGEGPGLPLIAQLQKQYPDRVFITQYEPAGTLEFHRQYDIAVIPTLGHEGTSLSLLEAMAAGCAVVCSNVGGMTNVVIDRYNGIMITPNAANLQAAIGELVADPEMANRLRFAARDTVENGFSRKLWDEKWSDFLSAFGVS
jgi:glycosyltransferase involved in cell wall biosynthesis